MISDLRRWIMLVEGVETVGDPPYRVYCDPTPNALINLVKSSKDHILKGLYDPSSGKVYIWDAYLASHSTAQCDLHLAYDLKQHRLLRSSSLKNSRRLPSKEPAPLVIGLNDDGKVGLHVCPDPHGDFGLEAKVKSLPTFKYVHDAIDDSVERRWR